MSKDDAQFELRQMGLDDLSERKEAPSKDDTKFKFRQIGLGNLSESKEVPGSALVRQDLRPALNEERSRRTAPSVNSLARYGNINEARREYNNSRKGTVLVGRVLIAMMAIGMTLGSVSQLKSCKDESVDQSEKANKSKKRKKR